MNLTQTITWIPVEERLPGKAGWYPVALPNGETRLDFWLTRDRYWMAHGRKPVTHWAEPLKHPSELANAPDIVAQRDALLAALENCIPSVEMRIAARGEIGYEAVIDEQLRNARAAIALTKGTL